MESTSSPNLSRLKQGILGKQKSLGKKRRLFKAVYPRPLVGLFLDPPEIVHSAEWPCPPGRRRVDVLIEALGLVAARREASVLYATYDDGAMFNLHWEHPFSSFGLSWNAGILGEFEIIHAEQGGPSYLCLCFPVEDSSVIFTRQGGLEICFYGSGDLWKELNRTLKEVARSPGG